MNKKQRQKRNRIKNARVIGSRFILWEIQKIIKKKKKWKKTFLKLNKIIFNNNSY